MIGVIPFAGIGFADGCALVAPDVGESCIECGSEMSGYFPVVVALVFGEIDRFDSGCGSGHDCLPARTIYKDLVLRIWDGALGGGV